MLLLPVNGVKGKSSVVEAIASHLKKKGKIVAEKDYGKRMLAYPVKKHKEGNYWLLNIETDSITANTLVKKLKFDEGILRHLMVSSK